MYKLAEAVKLAEINGFVGALVEAGIIKVANDEELAIVTDVIADHLPEDYTMEDAMSVAADVVDVLEGNAEGDVEGEGDGEGEEDEGLVVEASDKSFNKTAALAAYGELVLAKEAGDISEQEFTKEAGRVMDMLRAAKGRAGRGASRVANTSMADVGRGIAGAGRAVGRGVSGAGRAYKARMKGEGIGKAFRNLKDNFASQGIRSLGLKGGATRANMGNLAKRIGRTGAAYGATGAALGGAGYGAKKLYDKYNQGARNYLGGVVETAEDKWNAFRSK